MTLRGGGLEALLAGDARRIGIAMHRSAPFAA
jgi:hypothetical protein